MMKYSNLSLFSLFTIQLALINSGPKIWPGKFQKQTIHKF